MHYNYLIPVLVYVTKLLQATYCTTHEIKPTESSNCINRSCITLTNFSAYPTEDENITLILQPGNHSLYNNFSLSSIIGVRIYPLTNNLTTIFCVSSSHLSFESVGYLNIQNIHFKNCSIRMMNLCKVLLNDTTFASHVGTETALTLINVTAEIDNCSFSHNQIGTFRKKIKSKFSTVFLF